MTEAEDENSKEPRKVFLTDEALAVAKSISEWCDLQRDRANTLAANQIKVVWLLLLAGLILLLVLPRVVEEIEFFGRENSVPERIMSVANESSELLIQNDIEMREELESVTERLSTLEDAKNAASETRTNIEDEISKEVLLPNQLWKGISGVTVSDGDDFFFPKIRLLESGEVVAVGTRGRLLNGSFFAGEINDGSISFSPLRYSGSGTIGTFFDFLGDSLQETTAVGHEGTFNAPRAIVANADPNQSLDAATINSSDIASDGTVIETIPDVIVRQNFFGTAFETTADVLTYQRNEDGSYVRLRPDNMPLGRTPTGTVWEPTYVTVEEQNVSGTVFGVFETPSAGTIVTGRSGSIFEPETLLAVQMPNELTYADARPPTLSRGTLYQIDLVSNEDLLTVGYEQDEQGNFLTVALRSTDNGVSWVTERPEISGERVSGAILSFTVAPDGTIFAFGYEGSVGTSTPLLLKSSAKNEWSVIRPGFSDEITAGGLFAGHVDEDAIYVAGFDRSDRAPMFWSSKDEIDWQQLTLLSSSGRGRTTLGVGSLLRLDDGRFLLSTVNALLISEHAMTEQEVREFLLDQEAQNEYVMSESLRQKLVELQAAMETEAKALASYEQQLRFFETVDTSQVRQATSVQNMEDLSLALERALNSSDQIRQIGQIATRLAVLALLVYLVQIVVNRYRYLQRISGFYEARSQAFSLLAASENKTALLDDLNLADLTNLLSPDSIGFDKAADPPTSQMVSLLQAGLRKS